MSYCFTQKIEDSGTIWFVILCSETMSILVEPTKYLKHKTNEHCSPNTVQRIAYSISYYYCFLNERGVTAEQVLRMKYAAQHDHFIEFLYWLQAGNHCDRKKMPNNATCNSYLQAVFGYYEFILLEYENVGDIKVLENRDISYSSTAGVRFRRSINTFRGYLPEEDSVGRTIEEDKILILLETSDSLRNKLLILLLAETGYRIGEILGIRYAQDIDYEKHTIKVAYREDNENAARAKNAEIRRAKISDETFEIMMYYISENRRLLDKTEYLFVNLSGITKGKPMNVNAVYSAFALLEKKTGIVVTPHMLRHYFANERRKHGWSMEKISKALGHKHIATTEKYMNIEEEEMSEAMEQYYQENTGLYDISKIL
ncbi:MAG: tyrosine-type recombinase/integrase [Oribacterium sp.]|nr:tyrosine-type recombinase/integrase [Oribacterium sp.]